MRARTARMPLCDGGAAQFAAAAGTTAFLMVFGVACGGKSVSSERPSESDRAGAGGTTAGAGGRAAGSGGVDVAPPETFHAAIALPSSGLYGGVFLKVSDRADFTCEAVATVSRCAHWTVVVELDWELVRVGSIRLAGPGITASSSVQGPPDESGDCDSLIVSGTRGQLAIDAIEERVIRARLDELSAGGDPELALPSGVIEFEAARCPGDWRLQE